MFRHQRVFLLDASSAYGFNAKSEVYLTDFDEGEEFEVIRPENPWG